MRSVFGKLEAGEKKVLNDTSLKVKNIQRVAAIPQATRASAEEVVLETRRRGLEAVRPQLRRYLFELENGKQICINFLPYKQTGKVLCVFFPDATDDQEFYSFDIEVSDVKMAMARLDALDTKDAKVGEFILHLMQQPSEEPGKKAFEFLFANAKSPS
jgi:hypothetical protein